MKIFRSLLTSVFFIFWFTTLSAQDQIYPVIPGDFADPTVIRVKNTYYAVGTSSEWAPHFPVYHSDDLLHWTQKGYIFEQTPEWLSGSFWAPEYDYHDQTYFMYYTARRKKDNISCIGVATSKYPDHGFVDQGIIIDYGKEAIDAFIYEDKGIRYITFKAYGLDKRPIEILGYQLSKDGLHVEGEPFSLLKDDKGMGMEGQSFLKHDDYYYLFYSCGNCCGAQCDYNVRVARSTSFKGPYTKFDGDPLLAENKFWKCSGHGTFVKTADGSYQYLYHAYNKASDVYSGRQGMQAKLIWPGKGEWPKMVTQSGPIPPGQLSFDFKDTKPDKGWQWDFRNSTVKVVQGQGLLRLSGEVNEGNLTGIALTLRPFTSLFTVETTVENQDNGLKGLVYYGDANAAIGIGVNGEEVQYWMTKGKERKILSASSFKGKGPVSLRMKIGTDHLIHVYFKQGGADWQALDKVQLQSADFLPQWDRSPRIGLHFQGDSNQKAVFSNFKLAYSL